MHHIQFRLSLVLSFCILQFSFQNSGFNRRVEKKEAKREEKGKFKISGEWAKLRHKPRQLKRMKRANNCHSKHFHPWEYFPEFLMLKDSFPSSMYPNPNHPCWPQGYASLGIHRNIFSIIYDLFSNRIK